MDIWFRPRRRPGRLGPVSVSRLVAFQVIQVSLVAVLLPGGLAAVVGGVVGAAAIVVTLGRRRHRWWTESAILWLRLRRRRGVTQSQTRDPRLAALCQLIPDLAVENVAGTDGSQLGMASDSAGWFAVLEAQPAESGGNPPVPLSALARVAAEAEQAGVVMQVVLHSMPLGGEPGSAQRHLWVAVRLDADAIADSLVDDPQRQVAVPAVLAELVRRTDRTLRRRGLRSRALDADGLVDALVLSCDLAPTMLSNRPALVREDWDAWHSPRLAHRCFWLARWPDPDRGTSLLAGLADVPDARVSIALVLEPRPDPESVDLRCLVRVAATPDRSRQAAARSIQLAERLGGELYPLDGEHALAVYGTAPSGGGAR